jgi:hypothetical protein
MASYWNSAVERWIFSSLGLGKIGVFHVMLASAGNAAMSFVLLAQSKLSLRYGGKVLVRYHAGCAQRDVIDALTARGLWQFERSEDPWFPEIMKHGEKPTAVQSLLLGHACGFVFWDRDILRLSSGLEPDSTKLSAGKHRHYLRRCRALSNVAKVVSVNSEQSNRPGLRVSKGCGTVTSTT